MPSKIISHLYSHHSYKAQTIASHLLVMLPLFVGLLITAKPHAEAASKPFVSKQSTCLSALMATESIDSALRTTAQKTEQAFDYLFRFQQNFLGSKLGTKKFAPTIDEALASHTSNLENVKLVTERIEGAFRFDSGGNNTIQEIMEGKSLRRKVFAIHLNGDKEISDFLTRYEKNISNSTKTTEHAKAIALARTRLIQGNFKHIDYDHPVINGQANSSTMTALEIEYVFYKIRAPTLIREQLQQIETLGASNFARKRVVKIQNKFKKLLKKFEESHPNLIEKYQHGTPHQLQMLDLQILKSQNHLQLMSLFSINLLAELDAASKNRLPNMYFFKLSRQLKEAKKVYSWLFDPPTAQSPLIKSSLEGVDKISGLWMATIGVSQLFLGPNTLLFPLPDFIANSDNFYHFLGTYAFAGVMYFFVRPLSRLPGLWYKLKHRDRHTHSTFSRIKEIHESGEFHGGRWLYSGQNLVLSEGSLKFKKSFREEGISVNIEDFLRQKPFTSAIQATVSQDPIEKAFQKDVWTAMDLLYYHDDSSQEPTLTVVVRTSVEPPKFNRPKKKSKEKLKLEWNPWTKSQPQPVKVPQ